jgi:hypothetical protein
MITPDAQHDVQDLIGQRAVETKPPDGAHSYYDKALGRWVVIEEAKAN